MLKFLFWNINKRPLLELITRLVYEHDVDFLILAESELDNMRMFKSLNLQGRARYSLTPPGLLRPLQIYSRLSHRFVRPIKDGGGIAIRHIVPPIGDNLLLVAMHLPSRLFHTEQEQTINCTRFVRIIEEAERNVGHTRTLVIGDLNMNPFDCGVVAADGFHGVMDRRIAFQVRRQVAGEDRRFFYNPMWNYFGDMPPGPPGTYFYNKGGQVNLYWSIFDQVLIRPDLINAFSDENLRVLTKVGSTSLLSGSGRPNKKVGSDHFPILLSLKL